MSSPVIPEQTRRSKATERAARDLQSRRRVPCTSSSGIFPLFPKRARKEHRQFHKIRNVLPVPAFPPYEQIPLEINAYQLDAEYARNPKRQLAVEERLQRGWMRQDCEKRPMAEATRAF